MDHKEGSAANSVMNCVPSGRVHSRVSARDTRHAVVVELLVEVEHALGLGLLTPTRLACLVISVCSSSGCMLWWPRTSSLPRCGRTWRRSGS
jgi:uncharacterized iron-regulated membrane protein